MESAVRMVRDEWRGKVVGRESAVRMMRDEWRVRCGW